MKLLIQYRQNKGELQTEEINTERELKLFMNCMSEDKIKIVEIKNLNK